MRVLVTGGAGFIGSHLVEALLKRSYQVRVLDNLFTGQIENLPSHNDLEFIKGDITDYATCLAVMEGVDGVFHMAAMSKVLPSLANPEMIDFCAAQNAAGTANILKAALERKDRVRKVIYSGSSTYYGAGALPDHEDARHDCQTPYALTKYIGEMYCELFSRLHHLPTIRLRYFMVYGPRQPSSGPYAIVTGVFMNAWMRGEPLTILGTGHQTRDFIHVSEIAEANIRAFESTVTDATINVGTGRATSILELANVFSDKLIYMPPRVPDIPHSLADITRISELLGWVPTSDVVSYFKNEVRRRTAEAPDQYAKPAWLLVEAGDVAPATLPEADNLSLRISVIVPTYNRCETLRETLTCLANQDLNPRQYEVIVIDDGSPDATAGMVSEMAAIMPCSLRYLRHENHGAGYTANRGLRAAKAPLVLLIADDIQLMPETLSEHLRSHQAHSEREVCVLGRVDQSPELKQTVFIKNWDPFQFRDLTGVATLPYYRFWICNVSAKRDFLIRQNGFREADGWAGPHNHCDCELGYRLKKDGLKLLYNEKARAHHLHFETLDQAISRYYQRGLNWAPYMEMAPDPEINVAHHVFNTHTARDYLQVFQQPNQLRGRDARLATHLVFHLARIVSFNAVTVRFFWRPLFDLAEKSQPVAKLMNRQLYRVFLYYYFIKGVHDGRPVYGHMAASRLRRQPASDRPLALG